MDKPWYFEHQQQATIAAIQRCLRNAHVLYRYVRYVQVGGLDTGTRYTLAYCATCDHPQGKVLKKPFTFLYKELFETAHG
jgi:hypothetical protein